MSLICPLGNACTFFSTTDIFENGRQSEFVFVGRFVEYEAVRSETGMNLVNGLAKIKILNFWKGKRDNEIFYIEDYALNDICMSSFNPSIYKIGTEFLFAISKFRDNRVGFAIFSENYRKIENNYLITRYQTKKGIRIKKLSTYIARKIIKNKGLKP